MVCLKIFSLNNRFVKLSIIPSTFFCKSSGFSLCSAEFFTKKKLFFAKALTIRTFQVVKQECLFENFTNFLHSPTYKPRERRFFNLYIKLFQSVPTIPRTLERKNIDVLKKFSTYQRKIGVQSAYFCKNFTKFSQSLYLLEKKARSLNLFFGKFLQKKITPSHISHEKGVLRG